MCRSTQSGTKTSFARERGEYPRVTPPVFKANALMFGFVALARRIVPRTGVYVRFRASPIRVARCVHSSGTLSLLWAMPSARVKFARAAPFEIARRFGSAGIFPLTQVSATVESQISFWRWTTLVVPGHDL